MLSLRMFYYLNTIEVPVNTEVCDNLEIDALRIIVAAVICDARGVSFLDGSSFLAN